MPAGVQLIDWDMTGPPSIDTIDIVVPPYMDTRNALSHLREVKTKLVQSQSIGYDGTEAVLPPGIVFANAASVHEASTAEMTMALILASQRGIPEFVRDATTGKWSAKFYRSLADRTVLIVGYGGVGQAIESRLRAFEVNILRASFTPRSDENGDVHAYSELPSLLPLADIVVIAVRLSESTTHLVNDEFLSEMKDGSLLVNIARGKVANAEDLLAHAQTGRLRFALDVTDPEPLPENHPLFFLPNVLISPHVGGATDAALPRMAALIHEQARRMLNGEEPLNVVLRT
jgi:phosphoglycerate dehydrogenase-like enzyme